jgi:multidrug efflux system outer membrane protein
MNQVFGPGRPPVLPLPSSGRSGLPAAALSACALLLAMAGCAGIPAEHNVLPQQDMARAQLAANIKLAREGWPQAQWWTRYGDPQLNRLIAQALKDGPTLQAAAARIGSARAALQRDTSEKGLNTSLNATTGRTLYSADGFYPPPIGGSYYNETTVTVNAQYDFDWWGKHRAMIGAALGEVNARQAEYAQAEQTLAAAVAKNYFTLQGAWARLSNLRSMEATQRNLVSDKVKRIAQGIAGVDAERSAIAELGNLGLQAAQLDTQIAREREALRALLGADAQALTDLVPHPLPETPSALPAGIGIELLARRPDLQAARWRVEASLERIEAAEAAFYPDINLSGFFGTDTISLDQLFTYGSRTLSIGPALSLPLFDSGRLKAGLGAARTQRNEMIADYNQSVFNAVRDVALEAVSLQGLQKQVAEQEVTATATTAILHSTQARFKQGLSDNSTLLASELAVGKQQDASLQLKNQQLMADVALIKALGGGYQAPTNQTGTKLSQ